MLKTIIQTYNKIMLYIFISRSFSVAKIRPSMNEQYYLRKGIHPKEENIAFEFKGHRSLIDEEVPRLSKEGDRPCRQPVSKYACGMINSEKGGILHLGVLDDGVIEGIALTKFQQDHIRLSILNMFDHYEPKVPSHLVSGFFLIIFCCALRCKC